MGTSYEQWQPVIVLLWLLAVVLIIVLNVLFIRWLFRINEIAGYLKRIADKISPLPPPSSTPISLPKCDGCGKEFVSIELSKISSGQLLCRACRKIFENKKGEKA
jgi:hypothetical protein